MTARLPDAEPGQPTVEGLNVRGALKHLQLTDPFFSELATAFSPRRTILCRFTARICRLVLRQTENITQKNVVISKTSARIRLLLHIPANFRRPVMLIAEH